MSVKESPTELVSQFAADRRAPVDDRSTLSPHALPSISAVISRDRPLQYLHLHNSTPSYPQRHHPLWHSEQNPDAPPSHIYLPPRTNSHTAQSHMEPVLVTNPRNMAVPISSEPILAQRRQIKKISRRRDVSPKDEEHVYKLSPGTETSYVVKAESPKRPTSSRNGSLLPEAPATSISQPQDSRPLPIASLINSSTSHPLEPVPAHKYTIRMRQEPVAARACGFGERDRRVVDPPPILQMDVSSPNSTPDEISNLIRNPYTVVHCTLWDPVTDEDGTAMPGITDKRQQRRLMGTLVASPFVGMDEHNVEGCFFTFPDLSVRTPGTYALKFSLVVLDPQIMRPGYRSPIRDTVMSSVFQVFNAKDFKGMRASTELTKRLKHQGCLISVKKGNARSNGGTHGREDDEEDDYDEDGEGDDDGEGRAKRPSKRQKS